MARANLQDVRKCQEYINNVRRNVPRELHPVLAAIDNELEMFAKRPELPKTFLPRLRPGWRGTWVVQSLVQGGVLYIHVTPSREFPIEFVEKLHLAMVEQRVVSADQINPDNSIMIDLCDVD